MKDYSSEGATRGCVEGVWWRAEAYLSQGGRLKYEDGVECSSGVNSDMGWNIRLTRENEVEG